MRIIDKGSQPLSNIEVLAHINSLQSKYESQNRTKTIPEGARKAMRDVKTLFSIPTQPTGRANFTPETIHELTTTLHAKPFRLLQAEILQILNHVPRTVSELGMLLEDVEQRFSDERQEEMVAIITKIMGK